MKEIIKEYFTEKYKQLDEMTETIQNIEGNDFINNAELERLEEERRNLESIESELEEWINDNEA